MKRNYKYLLTISGLFVAVLLISNIASTKIVDFAWFTFDGGTLLFPVGYIFNDILTEVYGYKISRRVIWVGFVSAALMSAVLMVVGALPPAAGWNHQDAFNQVFGQTPRIVLASLVAYLCGGFANSYILAKMKILSRGKYLWSRTIGSTIVGELIDTLLFVLIAFVGTLSNSLVVSLIISNYVFKTLVEIMFTPATYRLVKWLKAREGEDYYDYETKFNPFKLT